MDLSEWVSLTVGIIGTGIAVYQWAVINESQKRRAELQFLLAGIQQIALSKNMKWNYQMNLLLPAQDGKDLEIFRLHARARDDFEEIRGLIPALEGVIDTKGSAITKMQEKLLEQTKLNNLIQAEGLKNPTLPQNQKIEKQEQPKDVS